MSDLPPVPPSHAAPGGPQEEIRSLRDRLDAIPRLLLIRVRSLGDSILTLPLLQALHAWRPALRLDLLIEAPFAPVFEKHPAVHELLVLQTKDTSARAGWSRSRALLEVRGRRYPAVLNLHGGTTSLLFSLASGAPLRFGQERFRGSRWYNARIPDSAGVWGKPKLHTVEHQLTFMKWLGLPIPSDPRPELHVAPASRKRIARRLEKAGLRPGAFLLVQPTATLATKQWPEENFARLADSLCEKAGTPLVFSTGGWEAGVLDRIRANARREHRYWADLALGDLFALIEACRLFVGNDSGPMHAAAALARPLVAIWGSSDHTAWHPWGSAYESVRSDLPCMPCPGYTCAVYGRPRCILEISTERVESACLRMLARY